jgi:Phage-integrase repeat unit
MITYHDEFMESVTLTHAVLEELEKRLTGEIEGIKRKISHEWKGWGDWLGTGTIAPQDTEWSKTGSKDSSLKLRIFEDARAFVHTLGLKNKVQWKAYCKSGELPSDLPAYPPKPYSDKWNGWRDWLGLLGVKTEFKPFNEARTYARNLGLKSGSEWTKYYKSGKLPPNIPAAPSGVYEKDWKGWGDWLGTGRIANFQRKYLPFKEARTFACSLNLKSSSEWQDFCKSGKKPVNVPYKPHEAYEEDWKGWGDWLGTVTTREIEFLPFEEAREFVRSLRLKNRDHFAKYCKSDKRPKDIPTQPSRTGTIATWQREYLPFEQAR